MLTLPALLTVDDVTVFGDDELFHRFYAHSETARVRTGEDGEPDLLLLVYALSDEERAGSPELPPGGGYLSFTTSLALTPAQETAVRTALTAYVAAEWERLRNGSAEDRARPGVAGTTAPPPVELGTPTFTSGRVTLDAPTSEALVSGRVAEAPSSLLGGNVAGFSMDLTPVGAVLLERLLAPEPPDPAGAPPGPAGAAADPAPAGADLTPVSVTYDLTFWGRLPAARIHMEVDAERLHTYLRKQILLLPSPLLLTSAYFERIVYQPPSLTLSGAVTVQIDTGSGSLPPAVVDSLRDYAFETLKSMVQTTFFTTHPADPSGGDGANLLLLNDFDNTTMSLRLDIEQSSVVQWRAGAHGMVDALLGDDPQVRARHVRRLDLGDDFFGHVTTDVSVFTDWAALDHAEVELEYTATASDGLAVRTGDLLTFTGPQSRRFSTQVVGSERGYRYRARSVLPGAVAGPWSDWTRTTYPTVAVSLPAPDVVDVEVVAGSVDFDTLVAQVQVRVAYEDPDAGVPRTERTVVLTKAATTGRFTRRLDVPRSPTGRLTRRTRFVLLDNTVVDDETWYPVEGAQVFVNQPTASVLRVSLLPAGNGWSSVVRAFVSLQADSPGAVATTIPLASATEFRTWTVYLSDAARRGYSYSWFASFTDGALVKQPLTTNPDGDPVLPVVLTRPGIDVTVVPDALDLVACPLSEVTLRWDSTGQTHTVAVRDRTPFQWHVTVPDGSPIAYTWQVTHHPPGRDPVVLAPCHETDDVVVLPAYRAATAGQLVVRVVAQLVAWAVTPIVGVDLDYDDGEGGLQQVSFTLTRDEPSALWTLPIRDARHTTYFSRITWFTTDGTPHPGDRVEQKVPRVVVPALTPVA